MKLVTAASICALAAARNVDIPIRGESFLSILSELVVDSSRISDLFSHGCWCARLGGSDANSIFLGGSTCVDVLDQICKEWFKARKCISITGGHCFTSSANSYTIELEPQAEPNCDTRENNADMCMMDACYVDLTYAQQLAEEINAGNLPAPFPRIADAGTCPADGLQNTCPKECQGVAPDVRAVCVGPPAPVEDPLVEVACRQAAIDLLFIVDGSGSVGRDNFQDVLTFIDSISRMLDVVVGGARVAMIQYSSQVRLEFGFLDSHAAVSSALANVDYYRRGTKTGLALQFAMDGILTSRTGDNELVVMVLTDGQSFDAAADDVAITGPAIQTMGTIFAVGVADASEDQLNSIATNPDSSHVFVTTDFADLVGIKDTLASAFCSVV